jgi:LacI family transcriptional regulator
MHDRAKGVVNVLPDDRAVGRIAAEHLLSLGLRNFASLAVDAPFARLREQGFVERLARKGYTCATTAEKPGGTDRWPMDPWSSKSTLGRLSRFLLDLPQPVGLLVWNDGAARTTIDAALEVGIKVPEDVAVVGVDNNRMRCELAEVPLTSVDLDEYRLGFEAAMWVDRLLSGEPTPDRPVLIEPKGLVARRSTDVLRIDDPQVARAVRWIRENGCRCTDLEEVMEGLTISRRSLDRKFRKAIGHSIGDELRRVRLSRARELVLESNMDLLGIALECGFSDLPHLSKSFKQAFGQSPSRYRKQRRI